MEVSKLYVDEPCKQKLPIKDKIVNSVALIGGAIQ
jgi:hypothetical protein